MFKICNFKRHQKSPNHLTATSVFLKIKEDSIGAPSAEEFRHAWEQLRGGNSGRAGKLDLGQYKKCRRMFWCLCEAMKDLDRRFLSQSGVVVVLHRDERTLEPKSGTTELPAAAWARQTLDYGGLFAGYGFAGTPN